MPKEYTVRDKTTGKTITFKWNGDQPPTQDDMADVIKAAGPQAPTPGSEGTRQDTNMIGVDHNAVLRKMADLSSKYLPASIAPTAAMVGTAAADIPLSALEMFSAPESVATMGMGGPKTPPKLPYTAPTTPVRDGMVMLGNELQAAPGAGMNAKLGGRVLSRLGSLKRTIAEPSVDQFAPNKSGYIPGQAASELHQGAGDLLPSVDQRMPNRPGVPDAGVPTGVMPQSSSVLVDHHMPNRPGVPDAGVEQGPMLQPIIDRYMPNASGRPPAPPAGTLSELQWRQLLGEHDQAVPPPTTGAPVPFSSAEIAAFKKQGYTLDQIAQMTPPKFSSGAPAPNVSPFRRIPPEPTPAPTAAPTPAPQVPPPNQAATAPAIQPSGVELNEATAAPTQPLAPPRLLARKPYTENFRSTDVKPNGLGVPWESGAEPGTADALSASRLHKSDAELAARWKVLMDNKNATWLLGMAPPAEAAREALIAHLKGSSE